MASLYHHHHHHLETSDGRLGLEVLVFSLLAMAVPLTYWIGGKWVKKIRLRNNEQLSGAKAEGRKITNSNSNSNTNTKKKKNKNNNRSNRASFGRRSPASSPASASEEFSTTAGSLPSTSDMIASSVARRAARKRYLVFLTLAWVVWGSSFLSAAFVMYRYLSRVTQKDDDNSSKSNRPLVLAHLGATFICSLFAEVFMISAFLTSVQPDIHEQERREKTNGNGNGNTAMSISPSSSETTTTARRWFPPRRFSITTPYSIVFILGLSMSLLGGVIVSLIEFLPDHNSKLVYTWLAGISILIGATKTHGLGGWIMHNNKAVRSSSKSSRISRGQGKRKSKEKNESAEMLVDSEKRFDSDWSFWQPGKGGNVFIATQIFGWCFFAMSLLGLGWISKFALAQIASCGVFCLRVVTVPTAAVMITAQLILAGSLTVFQVNGSNKEGEEEEMEDQAAGGDESKLGKGVIASSRSASEKPHQKKSQKQLQEVHPPARERYARFRNYMEDWFMVILFYCPHYITVAAVFLPYLFLPIIYASSMMMLTYLPLHLWGLIGQPQQTGMRESKYFLTWSGRIFEKICTRFLGGVTCICDTEEEEEEEEEVDGKKNDKKQYIFAYHPHALYPLGLVFYHKMTEFKKHFRSIRPIPLVASVIFRLPILGQLACRAGVREVTGSVFRKALADRGAVTLVPGGQAELCVAPRAHSEKNPEIVLNTRHKGFIKIALQTGSYLVPVFCFGEIYQLKNGLCFPRLQNWTYKQFGFPIPFLPVGRFGIPFPLNSKQSGHPFTFVVGSPMKVAHVQGRPVTQEEIDQTHARYFARVEKLFHKYKAQCGYQNKKFVLEDK